MGDDLKLVLIFVGLHMAGFVMVGVLVVMLLRSDTANTAMPPDEDDGDGGGSDRIPPTAPDEPRPGGLLPDAAPARKRLRGPAHLGDLLPPRTRRPAHDPQRAPRRVPI